MNETTGSLYLDDINIEIALKNKTDIIIIKMNLIIKIKFNPPKKKVK